VTDLHNWLNNWLENFNSQRKSEKKVPTWKIKILSQKAGFWPKNEQHQD